MAPTSPQLSIVVPFYDEETNVAQVVEDLDLCLTKAGIDYQLVAVNNGSRDRTGEILGQLASANSRITVCTIEQNQGYGFGIVSGLREADGILIGYMWGDRQVEARYLVDIYRAMGDRSVQIGKGSRQGTPGYSLFRRIQSRSFNALFRRVFGVASTDINGCPKVMRREAYEALSPASRDWFLDCEIVIKAHRLGMQVAEVPVAFNERVGGRSHVTLLTTLEFARNILYARLGLLPWGR